MSNSATSLRLLVRWNRDTDPEDKSSQNASASRTVIVGVHLQKRLGMLLGFIDAAEERRRVGIEVRYCHPGKLPRH
jgi:hypothetical protein